MLRKLNEVFYTALGAMQVSLYQGLLHKLFMLHHQTMSYCLFMHVNKQCQFEVCLIVYRRPVVIRVASSCRGCDG